MAKNSFQLAEVPFTLHYSQELLGMSRQKVIKHEITELDHVEVNSTLYSDVLNGCNGSTGDLTLENTVIIKMFDTLIHCYFKKNVCVWTAIYIDEKDDNKVKQYLRLMKRNYRKIEGDKNCFAHYKTNSYLSLFYDKKNSRYILGVMNLNEQITHALTYPVFKYGAN